LNSSAQCNDITEKLRLAQLRIEKDLELKLKEDEKKEAERERRREMREITARALEELKASETKLSDKEKEIQIKDSEIIRLRLLLGQRDSQPTGAVPSRHTPVPAALQPQNQVNTAAAKKKDAEDPQAVANDPDGKLRVMEAAAKLLSRASPTLGLLLTANKDSDNDRGVMITSVKPGSVADIAGLRPGLLVTQFNGEPITGGSDFGKKFSRMCPGDKVTFNVAQEFGLSEKQVEMSVHSKELDVIDITALNRIIAGTVRIGDAALIEDIEQRVSAAKGESSPQNSPKNRSKTPRLASPDTLTRRVLPMSPPSVSRPLPATEPLSPVSPQRSDSQRRLGGRVSRNQLRPGFGSTATRSLVLSESSDSPRSPDRIAVSARRSPAKSGDRGIAVTSRAPRESTSNYMKTTAASERKKVTPGNVSGENLSSQSNTRRTSEHQSRYESF
jgi:hypothetical protein